MYIKINQALTTKGSLHATIFSKYTELLQSKKILEYFEIIFEIY